jgi:ferredoxin
VLDPAAQPEEKVILAGQGCPTQAITIVKDGEKIV